MGSDFQQVDSFKHLRMQNRDEFEQASLRDSNQGLFFFNNFEKDFSGFKPPCQVSKQGTAVACTCPLNRMPG